MQESSSSLLASTSAYHDSAIIIPDNLVVSCSFELVKWQNAHSGGAEW